MDDLKKMVDKHNQNLTNQDSLIMQDSLLINTQEKNSSINNNKNCNLNFKSINLSNKSYINDNIND